MFYNSFPNDLWEDLNSIIPVLPIEAFNNIRKKISEDTVSYILDCGEIKFPYRIYFMDIDDPRYNSLTKRQKQIVSCIYTRSCDGYIREKHLRKLLETEFEPWVIPFIVKPCDEYVVEILEMIYEKLKDRNNTDIQTFCLANKAMIHRGYTRMISYWNEFYREEVFRFNQYIGRKLFRECFGYNRTFEK